MRFKGDRCADSVMAMDDQKQDRIVVREIRHCKCAGGGVSDLELKFVSDLHSIGPKLRMGLA